MASDLSRWRSATRCDLYLPGHELHYIQIKKSIENGALVPGTLVAIDGLDFTVEFPDVVRHYRNHRTAPLKRLVPVGGPVFVDERYRVLRTAPTGSRGASLCIATPRDSWKACSFSGPGDGTPEALAERLETRGGFLVAGEALTGLEGN